MNTTSVRHGKQCRTINQCLLPIMSI